MTGANDHGQQVPSPPFNADENAQTDREGASLKWTYYPNRYSYSMALLLFCGSIVIVVGLGALFRQPPIVVLIGAVAVLLALADFWMPTKFSMDAEKLTQRRGASTTEIFWKNVQRIERRNRSISIQTVAPDSKLAPFRGMELKFNEDQARMIEPFIRQKEQELC